MIYFKIYSRFIPGRITRRLRNLLAGPQKIPKHPGRIVRRTRSIISIRLQLQQGLTTEAAENCRKLVERFPNHPTTVDACLILGRQQLEAGHFDDAIKQLESLLERSPDLPARTGFGSNIFWARAITGVAMSSAARDIFQSLSIDIRLRSAKHPFQLGDLQSSARRCVRF